MKNQIKKSQLLKLKKENDNKLYKAVIRDILNNDYDNNNYYGYIKDVIFCGGVSGMINSLIYYVDTIKFYKKFQDEIENLIIELEQETGEPRSNLFSRHDFINMEKDQRQNLLAWFGYETICQQILDDLEIEF
jgi:hypothetical protein